MHRPFRPGMHGIVNAMYLSKFIAHGCAMNSSLAGGGAHRSPAGLFYPGEEFQ
jgi:hypothetical protein